MLLRVESVTSDFKKFSVTISCHECVQNAYCALVTLLSLARLINVYVGGGGGHELMFISSDFT